MEERKNPGKIIPFTSIAAKLLAKRNAELIECKRERRPVALLAERCKGRDPADWTGYTPMGYEPEESDKKTWLGYRPARRLKKKVSYDDLGPLYCKKMKTLLSCAGKLRLRFDNEGYDTWERNWRLMAIIAFNSGFCASKEDCEYIQLQAAGGGNPELETHENWGRVINRLNKALGTNVTADEVYKYRLNESEARIGGYNPEFKSDQDAVTRQYIKELDCIDYIKCIVRYNRPRPGKAPKKQKRRIGQRKPTEDDKRVTAACDITCVATSFKEAREMIYNNAPLLKRCVVHEDGTLEIDMGEMPVVVIRSTHGLRFRNKAMPLVYILFGPKCPKSLRNKYTEYARRFVFYERIVRDNHYVYTHEPERDLLRYIDLVAVSADYWAKNPEVRFRTNELEVSGQKINRSCVFEGTLFIRPDGQIRYKDPKGVQTEWEPDPAVNPGGVSTVSKTLPVKPEGEGE